MQQLNRTKVQLIAFIALIGISISIGSFYYLNKLKIDSNELLVKEAISNTNQKINRELKKITLAISALQVLFETTTSISREEYTRFTIPFVEGLPGIKALEWAPLILDSNRVAYETSVRAEGFAEYCITEADSINQKLVNSTRKNYYFPVHYIVPIFLNQIALGFDLASNADRWECIQNSQKTAGVAVSSPLKLIQNKDKSNSILIVQAVHRKKALLGVVLGVYNMDDFIEAILEEELKLLDIRIYDKTENYKSMFSNASGRPLPAARSIPVNILDNHFEVSLGDRVWAIYYVSNSAIQSFPHLAISYVSLLFGLLITFLLVLLLSNNVLAQWKLEQKVYDRTQELYKANKQQAVLLKEIHHRVKNNLQVITSLLSLQSSNIEDAKTKEIFNVSQYRINAMAMLHEQLYQSEDLSKISYGQYLEKLVKHLIISFKGNSNNIQLTIDVPQELRLNIDTAIPLGLLINEIITNSLKYGLPNQEKGLVYVQIIPETYPKFQLLIGDDGLGFSDEINDRTTKSLGLKLIRQLSRQLMGSVEKLEGKKGTHYRVYFEEVN